MLRGHWALTEHLKNIVFVSDDQSKVRPFWRPLKYAWSQRLKIKSSYLLSLARPHTCIFENRISPSGSSIKINATKNFINCLRTHARTHRTFFRDQHICRTVQHSYWSEWIAIMRVSISVLLIMVYANPFQWTSI